MRYRIPALLVAAMALVGLSAPVALASSQPQSLLASSCTVGTNTVKFHVESNDAKGLYVHYNGSGKIATVTTAPTDIYFKCVVSSPPTYVIHNASNRCIRMRDASNNYTVLEESACNDGDSNYQFYVKQGTSSDLFVFDNVHFSSRFLGVNCPAKNGKRIRGVKNAPGNCDNWLLLVP
jgi:hypothetical protein